MCNGHRGVGLLEVGGLGRDPLWFGGTDQDLRGREGGDQDRGQDHEVDLGDSGESDLDHVR